MRTLYFALSFVSSFLFSSPNLSGRRVDVYHTCTHGVALVRIQNAGLKRAARGSLKIQDAKKSPKNCHLGTIAQLCRAESSQIRHVSTTGKKICWTTCPPHVATIWRTSAHSRLRSFPEFGALQQISTGFASWLRYCSDVARRRPTQLCTMFGRLLGWYNIYIYTFGGFCPLTEFYHVQNSRYVQVLRSPILAASLHGTPAAVVSQTLRVIQVTELRNFRASYGQLSIKFENPTTIRSWVANLRVLT